MTCSPSRRPGDGCGVCRSGNTAAKRDFVTIHAALTDANQGMMGEAELKQMKPTALLVNTARGGHVQELALMEALKQGVIAGAALDAYVQEPLPEDHPYRTTPNLLMSPHRHPVVGDG